MELPYKLLILRFRKRLKKQIDYIKSKNIGVIFFTQLFLFLEIHKILKIRSVTKPFSTSLEIQNFVNLRDRNNFEKAQGIWEKERIIRTRKNDVLLMTHGKRKLFLVTEIVGVEP